MKVCGRCKESFPEDNFRWKNKARGWRQSYCIPCNKEKNKEHYVLNKQTYLEKQKKYRQTVDTTDVRRMKQYGITEQELVQLLAANDGICQICKENLVQVIDHCHKTGKVRSALCSPCNRGLGFFRDNAESLERAASYIKQHGPLE